MRPQADSRVPPSVNEQQVNMGRLPGLPVGRTTSAVHRLGASSVERPWGWRSRR